MVDPQLKRGLLDACVLSLLRRGDSYGYQLIKDISPYIDVSESTLYPVLRRLQKDDCLEVYDRQYDGRNRRYYKITPRGEAQLNLYRSEWKSYSEKISEIFEGGAIL